MGSAASQTSSPTAELAAILELVRERRGVDFSRYRPATVERRVQNRMLSVNAANHAAYLELLRAHPEETDRLVDRLTIKVSRLFRNANVFRALRDIVLPDLARRFAGETVQIWSAGCGRGEEAYSLAMVLADPPIAAALPDASVRATDIDAEALACAREGAYGPAAFGEIPGEDAERSFEGAGPDGRRRVCQRVRAKVEFVRHDLTAAASPPAPGRFHLVTCRNVLIYLRPEAQACVQRLLARAIVPSGYLCLGEAEWPSAELIPHLEIVDRNGRLFRRKPERCGERRT